MDAPIQRIEKSLSRLKKSACNSLDRRSDAFDQLHIYHGPEIERHHSFRLRSSKHATGFAGLPLAPTRSPTQTLNYVSARQIERRNKHL